MLYRGISCKRKKCNAYTLCSFFFFGGGGVIIAFYWIKPFSTAISALMTEEVAAPNLTLSIKQTNLTSKTGHSLILPTLTQAPL